MTAELYLGHMTNQSQCKLSTMPNQTFFNLPEKKQATIIDLAIAEFANNDYKNASITKIVKQAKIAKGSFYQ